MATKKQLAARKRFSQIMKSGGFKKRKGTKKGSVRKTARRAYIPTKTAKKIRLSKPIRRRKSSTNTMRRRKSSYRRSAKSGLTSIFKGGLLGKAAAGIGAATVMGLIVSNVAPQFNSISQVAGGYLGGGAIGAVSALLVNGGLGNIGNILGGNQQVTSQVEAGV
jgi:hypothetical protein